jgi:hypothetical protein
VLDSARTVAGVLSLAKCDRRLVVDRWPCEPNLEAAVDDWLSSHAVLDPRAWTARAALMSSFVGADRLGPAELIVALDARGITPRRKGNVHGFDGVALQEDGDVEG